MAANRKGGHIHRSEELETYFKLDKLGPINITNNTNSAINDSGSLGHHCTIIDSY